MNRRAFIVSAGSAAVLPLAGCPWSKTQIENEINTILDQAANVLVVVEPNAFWLAPFQKAIAALKVAEQQWTAGGTINIIIDALNAVEGVLAVIPTTAPYAALIAVLVGGIEAILNALPQRAAVMARVAAPNPYHGQVKIAPNAKAFKTAWNAACDAKPELAGAKLP